MSAEETLAQNVTFATVVALEDGLLDDYLDTLWIAVLARKRLYDPTRSPLRTDEMKMNGQVWAWMQGPGRPHWEVRGTGARL